MSAPFTPRRLLPCAALALLCALPGAALAAEPPLYGVWVSANSSKLHSHGPSDLATPIGSTTVTASANSVDGTPFNSPPPTVPPADPFWDSYGRSSSWGTAGPGLLGAKAQADAGTWASREQGLGTASSSAQSFMEDSLTILAGGCATCTVGSVGTLTFAVTLNASPYGSGSYSVTGAPGTGPSQWGGLSITGEGGAAFTMDAGTVAGAASRTQADWSWNYSNQNGEVSTGSSGSGLHLGTQTYTMSFLFGTPIEMRWGLTAGISLWTSATGDESLIVSQGEAMLDLSHTLAWGGVIGITDAGGQAVSLDGVTALNRGGTSFLQAFATAVPEPSQWLLMGLGLLALGGWLRQRGRRAGG